MAQKASAQGHMRDIDYGLLERYLAEGNEVARQCAGKDVVILMGHTGAGKSVLFNFLIGVPLCKKPADPLALVDYVVDVVNPLDDAAPIGHDKQAKTLIPKVSVLVNGEDPLFLCDSPGFLDNRCMEIHIANAVNIRNILFSARGVKIILVIECSSLTTGRQDLVNRVAEIACNLFGSEDSLCQHVDSILLCISKVPEAFTSVPLDRIKENLRANPESSQSGQPSCLPALSHNVFTFNPLDSGTLRYEPVSTREELVERLRQMPVILEPHTQFRTSLSNDDTSAIEEMFRQWNNKIQECLNSEDLLTASRYFQKLKSLRVLGHPVIERAIDDTRKNIKNLQMNIESKAKLSIAEGNLEVTEEQLVDLAKLVETFELVDCESQLQELETKYKDKKWWRTVKIGATVAVVATAVIVAGAAVAVASPAIPIGAAGGTLLAAGASGAEVGLVATVTNAVANQVEKFSARKAASAKKPTTTDNSSCTPTAIENTENLKPSV